MVAAETHRYLGNVERGEGHMEKAQEEFQKGLKKLSDAQEC